MSSSILDQFSSFQHALGENLHSILEDTRENDLKRLRKENEALLLKQILLLEELRLKTAVHAFLQNMQTRDLVKAFPVDMEALEKVYEATCAFVDDNFMSEYMVNLLKKGSSGKKRSRSHDSNNNNNDGNQHEYTKERSKNAELPLTRSQKKSKGGKLINPIKYFDCLLCPRSDYGEKTIRVHYAESHGLDFGDAKLPTDKLQILCHQVDLQTKSTRCFLCNTDFDSTEDLKVHKSHHVDPKYCQYKCDQCSQAFVLKEELRNHQMLCSF